MNSKQLHLLLFLAPLHIRRLCHLQSFSRICSHGFCVRFLGLVDFSLSTHIPILSPANARISCIMHYVSIHPSLVLHLLHQPEPIIKRFSSMVLHWMPQRSDERAVWVNEKKEIRRKGGEEATIGGQPLCSKPTVRKSCIPSSVYTILGCVPAHRSAHIEESCRRALDVQLLFRSLY